MARLEARIQDLVGQGDWAEAARRGARSLAVALGLDECTTLSRGQAAREVADQAALLGQFVSTGGADPMRSFPFLVGDASRADLERLCAEVAPLPPGAEDPLSPEGKGRLVYWHENLVSGVDATGFCVFSMAGLLADGVCDLDRLAGWILPASLRDAPDPDWGALAPGRRLLALGANLVLLRQELERIWGVPSEAPPAWARGRLAAPGMQAEYRDYRGLDALDAPRAERRDQLGTPRVLARESCATSTALAEGEALPGPAESEPRCEGVVELRASGPLAEALGPGARIRLNLPAPVREVLMRTAERDASIARQLWRRDQAIPSVWRDGERLEPGALVRAGDVLDLVTAISGG